MPISAFLRNLGLERYEKTFKDNAIDARVLTTLTSDDLKELGVALVGHRRLLLNAIAALPAQAEDRDDAASASGTSDRGAVDIRPASGGADRRQLTTLFCDLVGSTELSADLDPEDMGDLIRAFQNACAGVITRFEGYVAKFMGDGVLGYFGYPQAHEDEAGRAVRCGLALARTVGSMMAPNGNPLAVRVGIATGVVVVGVRIGDGMAREEAAVGGALNLAARLQEIAVPGTVVIAEATRALLGNAFEIEDLGAQELKGLGKDLRAYAVRAERAVDRFNARGGTILPMLGRASESSLLNERWSVAARGEGQCLLLVGEAGIGKSRIVRNMLDMLDMLGNEAAARVMFQCSPAHTDSALWPVMRQLENEAGVLEDDEARVRLGKLKELLETERAPATALPLIADFLGIVRVANVASPDVSVQAKREMMLGALANRLLGKARRRPLLVVLEDAHWVDPTTLELIEAVIDGIADATVLVLLTSRPDGQPKIAGRQYVTKLTLNRLARSEVEEMIRRIAGGRLAKKMVDAIAERTDGVPLFIEELTKAVLEGSTTGIPASLHDTLMARLDRIPEVKAVAQAAACIGREFDGTLLAELLDMSAAELDAQLERLVAAELIFRRRLSGAQHFTFKHALVRDAALNSLLHRKRFKIHSRLAEILMERRRAEAIIAPELIAYHLVEGNSPAQSVPYWVDAIERALLNGAEREASEFCQKGLRSAASIEAPEDRDAASCDILLLQYGAVYPKGEVENLATLIEQAGEFAERLGDLERQSRVADAKAYVYSSLGRMSEAIAAGRRGVEISTELGVDDAINQAHMMLARALYAAGDYREAVTQISVARDRLGDDLERGKVPGRMNQTTNTRVWRCFMRCEMGNFEAAERDIAEAYGFLPRIPANEHISLWTDLAAGRLCYLRGDHGAVVDALERQRDLCRRDYPVYFQRLAMSLGPALAKVGRGSEGRDLLEEADIQGEALKFVFFRAQLLAQFSLVVLEAGDADRARVIADRAVIVAQRAGEAGNLAWATFAAGAAASLLGDEDRAHALLASAKQQAEIRGMDPLIKRSSAARL